MLKVKKQYDFVSKDCIYYTKLLLGNKYLIFQSREDFKLHVLDSMTFEPVKQMAYGVKDHLKFVFEEDTYILLVFESILITIDSTSLNQKVKQTIGLHLSKVTTLNDELLIAITEEGIILLLDKRSLEIKC